MSTDDEREGPAGLGVPESCLGPEVVAAFLDGTLEGREKEDVQAHLAACSDCYALFGESADFLREAPFPEARAAVPESPGPVRGRMAAWLVPLGIAAALVVVLLRPSRVVAPTIVGERATQAATLSSPASVPSDAGPPIPESAASPVLSSGLAGPLMDAVDSTPLVGAAWRDDPAGLGFAGGGSRERTLVLVGVHLLDLELAVRRGDLSSARDRLASLEPLAESIAQGSAIRSFADRLKAGRLPSLDTDELGARLASGATRPGTTDASRLIRFGEWVEACRLAAVIRHSRYFGQAEVRRGLTDAGDLPLPEPMRRALAAVEALLRPHPVSEVEWRRLERTLDQVLLLL